MWRTGEGEGFVDTSAVKHMVGSKNSRAHLSEDVSQLRKTSKGKQMKERRREQIENNYQRITRNHKGSNDTALSIFKIFLEIVYRVRRHTQKYYL